MSSIKSQISDIYYHLLPDELLKSTLTEKKADCSNCSMARPNHKGKYPYLPDLKCCTFQPFLPNYLVGLILESKPPLTKADVVLKMILENKFILPIGIIPSYHFQVEFNHRKLGEFGNRKDWLCPYFDKQNQNCGIWQNRGSVCTSFLCKSSYGKSGIKFWNSLSNYLHYVEMALQEECLVMLDFSPRQTNDMLDLLNRQKATKTELKMLKWSVKDEKKYWKDYYTDKVGFYLKCAQIVKNMSKKEFKILLGDHGKNLWQAVKTDLDKI